MAARAGAAPPLFTAVFLGLCLVNFLAFCNLSIFYGFHDHLAALGVPEAWRGPLLALEPLAAFALRPVLGPLVTPRNGVRLVGGGLLLLTLALAAYPSVRSIPAVAAVRVLHGLGFAVLVSAVVGLVVHVVPRERMGQGFGIFTLTTLVPHAAMPVLVEKALPHLPGPGQAYALASPLMLLALLLMPSMARRMRELAANLPPEVRERPGRTDIRANLRAPGVGPLLGVALGLYTASSAAFFFFRPLGLAAGLANPGTFFACSALANITLRVAASRLFDRLDKRRTLAASLGLLAAVLVFTPLVGSPEPLLALAVCYGLAQGLAMPLLSSLMVLVSPARLKSLNANLLLLAMDAGYFLGPLAGGLTVLGGLGLVFWMGAGLVLAALATVVLARRGLAAAGQPEEGGRVRPPERGGD